jgi:hypothetical protein
MRKEKCKMETNKGCVNILADTLEVDSKPREKN